MWPGATQAWAISLRDLGGPLWAETLVGAQGGCRPSVAAKRSQGSHSRPHRCSPGARWAASRSSMAGCWTCSDTDAIFPTPAIPRQPSQPHCDRRGAGQFALFLLTIFFVPLAQFCTQHAEFAGPSSTHASRTWARILPGKALQSVGVYLIDIPDQGPQHMPQTRDQFSASLTFAYLRTAQGAQIGTIRVSSASFAFRVNNARA
jgi:hypothetical protein